MRRGLGQVVVNKDPAAFFLGNLEENNKKEDDEKNKKAASGVAALCATLDVPSVRRVAARGARY